MVAVGVPLTLARVPPPITLAPSRNSTGPLAEEGETVADKVSDFPSVAVLAMDPSVVVVG